MIYYNVLGSAPLYMGQPVLDTPPPHLGLVSFYDYPKAFQSLSQLNQTIQDKLHDRHDNGPQDSR